MALNAKQKRACEVLVAEPERQYKEIAAVVGVDTATLWRWRQKPEWREYEHALCMDRFQDLERLAIQKLQQNASKGNQRAVEYILNYVGYLPNTKVDVSTNDIVITITGEDDGDKD